MDTKPVVLQGRNIEKALRCLWFQVNKRICAPHSPIRCVRCKFVVQSFVAYVSQTLQRKAHSRSAKWRRVQTL
jgi:hypothetical protein